MKNDTIFELGMLTLMSIAIGIGIYAIAPKIFVISLIAISIGIITLFTTK